MIHRTTAMLAIYLIHTCWTLGMGGGQCFESTLAALAATTAHVSLSRPLAGHA